MQESWVQTLCQEDLLEKEMVTHSSILAWKIPWMEEPSIDYSPWGRKELDTTEQLHFLSLLSKLSLARKSPQAKSHYAGDFECMDMVGTQRTLMEAIQYFPALFLRKLLEDVLQPNHGASQKRRDGVQELELPK